MGLAVESEKRDVEESHPAVGGGVLTEFSFMVRCHHGDSVILPGIFGPGIFFKQDKRILHPVDPAEMADVDAPSSGVVLAHGEEIFAYLMHG